MWRSSAETKFHLRLYSIVLLESKIGYKHLVRYNDAIGQNTKDKEDKNIFISKHLITLMFVALPFDIL